MGLLVDGSWQDRWYDTDTTGGSFERSESSFRSWVTPDGSAGPSGAAGCAPEPGRYHLYVGYAWALVWRTLKGLEEAYEAAINPLFDTLDAIEARLAEHRYLVADRPLEADWRLFPTLLRFDLVHHGHFKCNLRRIADYPHLFGLPARAGAVARHRRHLRSARARAPLGVKRGDRGPALGRALPRLIWFTFPFRQAPRT